VSSTIELTTPTGATIRPIKPADHAALRALRAHPAVAEFWPAHEGDAAWLEEGDEVKLTIVVDGQLAGLVQYLEETEPDYRHAGLDIFIGQRWHGSGLGTDALRTVARYLIEGLGHHRLVIDPALHNTRAIASYRKVGFKPVGVMRRAERDVDRRGWHDCLMMDLLAEELS